MRFLIVIFTFSCFIISPILNYGYSMENPPTEKELANFYREMQVEIDYAEKKVEMLLEKVKQQDTIFSKIARMELETAIVMLDVKKTLVANFAGKPSLESPLVRNKLISILRKDIIDQIDLLELQNLVDIEKSKVA